MGSMGLTSSNIAIPRPDDRVKKAMALGSLTMVDVHKFWIDFRKLQDQSLKQELHSDASSDSSGGSEVKQSCQISIGTFYKTLDEEPSQYSDALFELLDIDIAKNHSERSLSLTPLSQPPCRQLTFGEFLHSIVVMCLLVRVDFSSFIFIFFK